MSLTLMQRRLEHQGGQSQQQRMIKDKLRSMLAATKHSYQAAEFQEWTNGETPVHKGLFNPMYKTEDYDTKIISVPFDSGFKVGTYFEWKNTKTNWIIFLQEHTELAYFRGHCRLCSHKVQWVDEGRQLMETLVSVIGPSAKLIDTSSSVQAGMSTDSPTANIRLLVQNNPLNKDFFGRYQTFILDGVSYRVEQLDILSMPGVIQLEAREYYTNLIEDDVEKEIRNAWNVQPVLPEHDTEYAIEGPDSVKPQMIAEFEVLTSGGEWVIVENIDLPRSKRPHPVVFMDNDVTKSKIRVKWESPKSGVYTIGYRKPDGKIFQKAVYVESMF